MIHKLLILTSDPTTLTWKSLEDKKQQILGALNETKNAVWQVEIQYRPLVPKVTATGHIDRKWFNGVSYPLFRQGYDHVCLHFSMKQWELYGLKGTIRGGRHADDDFVGEMYIRADEATKRGRFNQFVQTMLHEVWHELCDSTGVPDTLHEWHDNNTDITGADWSIFDMNNWQPVYQEGMVKVGLLQRILELTKTFNFLKKKPKLVHPVPKQFRRVTQKYGNPNAWYKITRHHIGIDYGTPTGTPLVAPADGEVTEAGETKTLGYYLQYRFNKDGKDYVMRLNHLNVLPKKGRFQAGDVIGISGNTGFSFGAHTHLDISPERVNLAGINEQNWRERFIDPDTVLPNN